MTKRRTLLFTEQGGEKFFLNGRAVKCYVNIVEDIFVIYIAERSEVLFSKQKRKKLVFTWRREGSSILFTPHGREKKRLVNLTMVVNTWFISQGENSFVYFAKVL